MPPLSATQAHCFLRNKVAVLSFVWESAPGESARRKTLCHAADEECRRLRCRLSGCEEQEPLKDPWFDD